MASTNNENAPTSTSAASPPTPSTHKNCAHCATANATKKCPCKEASYCNVDCQKAAWLSHKKTCSYTKPSKTTTPTPNPSATTRHLVEGDGVGDSSLDLVQKLFEECTDGRASAVSALIREGADPNCLARSDDGSDFTPLIVSIQYNKPLVVTVLIACGSDVNRADDEFNTPLTLASEYGFVEIVEALLAAKADVNYDKRNTALYAASANGHAAVVKALLKAGADFNHVDKRNATALFIACMNNHADVVKALLDSNADPGIGAADEKGNAWLPLQTTENNEIEELIRKRMTKSGGGGGGGNGE